MPRFNAGNTRKQGSGKVIRFAWARCSVRIALVQFTRAMPILR